jgi:hypothetical protein
MLQHPALSKRRVAGITRVASGLGLAADRSGDVCLRRAHTPRLGELPKELQVVRNSSQKWQSASLRR